MKSIWLGLRKFSAKYKVYSQKQSSITAIQSTLEKDEDNVPVIVEKPQNKNHKPENQYRLSKKQGQKIFNKKDLTIIQEEQSSSDSDSSSLFSVAQIEEELPVDESRTKKQEFMNQRV